MSLQLTNLISIASYSIFYTRSTLSSSFTSPIMSVIDQPWGVLRDLWKQIQDQQNMSKDMFNSRLDDRSENISTYVKMLESMHETKDTIIDALFQHIDQLDKAWEAATESMSQTSRRLSADAEIKV